MIALHRLSLFVAGALLSAPALAAQPAAALKNCSELRSCEAKFCHIENSIAAAQANGNTHREAGLRRALEEAKQYCTPAGLRDERLQAIEDEKEDVREREEKLAEALRDGKQDKINKAERKLKEAQAELQEAQAQLDR